jgi:quercetin dioxygenase-like cupin family protein
MKSTIFTLASIGLSACATAPAPVAGPAHHPATAFTGPPAQLLERPNASTAGGPKEVRVLYDDPTLKLAAIVLRDGTLLPEHHSAVPVTIQAVEGAGTVIAGGERHRLDATHLVVLAPGVPHAVEPDPGTTLVLLVHHLGRGPEHTH